MLASWLLVAGAMSRTLACLCVLSSFAVAQPAPPIVGGTKVPYGTWPDVVAVKGLSGTCTGTLIAPDVVVTAGHCIEIEPVEVVVETIDYGHDYPGQHIPVKWSRAYPSWSERYDVGVILLEHAARPRPRPVAGACHANARLAAGAPVRIVGFGLTTPSATDDNTVLHEATVPVLDPFCEAMPGCLPAVAPKGEFAAGGRGIDTCFGDSGGPALLDTDDGPVLVGVVSRGLAVAGTPCGNGGIYVRVDKVVSWIQSVTGRTLTRTTCQGRGDDAGAQDPESIGCSVRGGGGLGGGLVLLALRRRRRRAHVRH